MKSLFYLQISILIVLSFEQCSVNQYIVRTNQCVTPSDATCSNGDCRCTDKTKYFNRIDNKCESCPEGVSVSEDGISCDCEYKKHFNQNTKQCEYDYDYSCDKDQFYDEESRKCLSCPTGATNDAHSDNNCKCPDNKFMNSNNNCIDCPTGSTINKYGYGCDCGDNKIYSFDDNQCKACPSGSTSDGFTCKCSDSNLRWDSISWSCKPCKDGEEIDEYGGCSCKEGYIMDYSKDDAVCRKCPNGTENDNSCKCGNDEIFDDSTFTCVKCEKGKDSSGYYCKCDENEYFHSKEKKCKALPANSKQSEGSYSCNENYYDDEKGQCVPCPDGTTSYAGSKSINSCTCSTGYSKITCASCGEHGYSDGNKYDCHCTGDFEWEEDKCVYEGKFSESSNSRLIQLSLSLFALFLIL